MGEMRWRVRSEEDERRSLGTARMVREDRRLRSAATEEVEEIREVN